MRKTRKEKPPLIFSPDIKTRIPEKQLAGIGAIILAFNELEATFDQFIFIVTGIEGDLRWEVSSRISGLEAKVAIIKKGVADTLDDAEKRALDISFGAHCYEKIKTVRDSLAHLRHLNIGDDIGLLLKVSKDLKVFDVLARQDVLDITYAQLVSFHREIFTTLRLVSNIKLLKKVEPGDPKNEQYEQRIQECRDLIHRHRKYRLSLPPIPEFPSESELREAEIRVQQSQLALTMASLGQWLIPPLPEKYSAAASSSTAVVLPPLPLREVHPDPKKGEEG